MKRKCTKCKKVKPISEYYKNQKGQAGWNTACMSCKKEVEKNRKATDWLKIIIG